METSQDTVTFCEDCGRHVSVDNLCPHFQIEDNEEVFVGSSEVQSEQDTSSICQNDEMTFEELLIANVESRPILWNSKLPLQKRSKTEKDQLWLEIKHFFGDQYSIEILQKKWRNLRDQFVKIKGELETYVPSGSGTKPKKIWKYYQQMKFLSDTMNPRATTGNLPSVNLPSTSRSSSSVGTPTPEPQTPRVKRSKKDETSNLIVEAIRNIPPPPPLPQNMTMPRINPICLRLSEMLEDLSPEDKINLEIKLLQVAKDFIYKKNTE